MSNPHDPTAIYAKLGELWAEAQRVHEASGRALCEIVNALARKADADAAFLAAFSHLVPQPMSEAPPAGGDHYRDEHAWDVAAPAAPPPRPEAAGAQVPPADPGSYSDEESALAFEAAMRERRGQGRRW